MNNQVATPAERAQATLALRERGAFDVEVSSVHDAFKQTYFYDLAGFVHECFIWDDEEQGPVVYQDEVMRKLVEKRRASLRGPHGLGKTALAAWVVLWFALTHDGLDWKVPTTASAWRQLTKFLWPEIHKWSRRLKWEKIGRAAFNKNELLALSLKLSTGEAFALASDTPALLEGAHAKYLLYIFDESKAIPAETWDAVEGALSVGETYILAISTPGEPNGRFYDIHRRATGYEDWWVRHVKKEEVIKAGRMDRKWAEQRRLQWGEDSAVYRNRVKGEFAASDEDSVISLAMVERANERWQARMDAGEEFRGDKIFSVDVGRGGDPTVLGTMIGNIITTLERHNWHSVMPIAGAVVARLKKRGNEKAHAIIDVNGIGAGSYDRAREDERVGERVFAFVAAASAGDLLDRSEELGFVNMRSYGWWSVREMLMFDELDLPPDDKLTGDLTAPKWKIMSGGKIQVEKKEDIKKRLGRSTDDGDVVIQAVAAKTIIGSQAADMMGLGSTKDDEENFLPDEDVKPTGLWR